MDYESLESIKSALSWHQVSTKLALGWSDVEPLLKMLREAMGWKDATKFKRKYLNPLIESGLVELSIPDKPTSPNQRYRLTEKGKALLDG